MGNRYLVSVYTQNVDFRKAHTYIKILCVCIFIKSHLIPRAVLTIRKNITMPLVRNLNNQGSKNYYFYLSVIGLWFK